MVGFVIVFNFLYWIPPLFVGISYGRQGRTVNRAFLRGTLAAYLVALMGFAVIAVILDVLIPYHRWSLREQVPMLELTVGRGPDPEIVLHALLSSLLPAFLAGVVGSS